MKRTVLQLIEMASFRGLPEGVEVEGLEGPPGPKGIDGLRGPVGPAPTAQVVQDAIVAFIAAHPDQFRGLQGYAGPVGSVGAQGPAGNFPKAIIYALWGLTAALVGLALTVAFLAIVLLLSRGEVTDTDKVIADRVDAVIAAHPDQFRGKDGKNGIAGENGTNATNEGTAAILLADPEFVASLQGKDGRQGDPGTMGPAGISPTPQDVVAALFVDPAFVAKTKGDPGPEGKTGPVGPVAPGAEISKVFASLETCASIYMPHVGSTAGWYFKCPDGTEFTLPLGGHLTLADAHERLAGR